MNIVVAQTRDLAAMAPGEELSPFGEFKNIHNAEETPFIEMLTEIEQMSFKSLPESQKEELAKSWTKNKLVNLCRRLHSLHGQKLFAFSKAMHRLYGRTWIFVRFDIECWKNEDIPLVLNAFVSNNVWDAESDPESLKMLYEMDPAKEYMISIEVTNREHDWTYFQLATVIDISAAGPVVPPTARKLELCFMPLIARKEFHKWTCRACFGAETHKKHMVCSRCKVSRYCTPQCQKEDYSNHKLVCSWLAKLKKQYDAEKKA